MKERTTIQLSADLRRKLKILASRRDETYQNLLNNIIGVFSELDPDKTILSIPKKLSFKINNLIEETDFKNISEYVTFILRLIIYEDVKVERINENKIKNRLKLLGYL